MDILTFLRSIPGSYKTNHSVRGMVLVKAMTVILSPLISLLQLSLQTLLKSIGVGHLHMNWGQQINLEKPQKSHQPVVIISNSPHPGFKDKA